MTLLRWMGIERAQRKKTYLFTHAPNGNPDQSTHPRSMIRVFVRMKKLFILGYQKLRPVKILIWLCECAGWSESALGAQVRKYVFWQLGSNADSTNKIRKICHLYPVEIGKSQSQARTTFKWEMKVILFRLCLLSASPFEQKREDTNKWPGTSENVPSDTCAQRRLKSDYACAQSDQSLCCPHEETLHPWRSKLCPVKILIRLRERAVWSESSLGAHVRRYVSWRFGSNDS